VIDGDKKKEGKNDTNQNPVAPFSAPSSVTPEQDVPDTAASAMTFQTAFETLPPNSIESSPTTPKPTETKRPEYIHVPWDHNTDVKDELWDLCELIESRTKEGKRVLVHCQQGASRSATLIIAYGMYTNKEIGPTEAYQMAQAKSRWVNPNMSLLFSLNDFKKIVDKRKGEMKLPIRKPPPKHRSTLSANSLDAPPTPSRARGNSTPSTAARDHVLSSKPDDSPLPTHSAIERLGAFDFGFGEISISNQRHEREKSRERNVIPQPSIPAPPQRLAPEPPRAASHQPFGFADNEPARAVSHDLPRAVSSNFPRPVSSNWEDLMSPRLTEMTNNPLQAFSRGLGSTEAVPPTPGLFSPRAFEFPASSFFPPPAPPIAPLPVEEDPRSPPTKGEAPITRSIDHFL
jgi:tyrosine-protein phosphatase